MKRMFGLAASALISIFSIGTVNAGEFIDQQMFIAAMEDSYEGYNYRNTMDLSKFVAALEDSRPGYYRNIHTQESFVASLGDDYTPERYAYIMDNSRFAALLAEKDAEQATTAGLTPRCGHRDVDYLGGNVMVAMLTEGCK